ncbi:hypothetical protein K439DRAFT_560395 [Ramaria rubella]|nr:hypothetical protein K439DRAFT_560395 [Ramaria rubella]
MTAPRSSLVNQFLSPSSFDLCLHVGEHDDLAIAVAARVVRGFYYFCFCFCAAPVRSLTRAKLKQISVLFSVDYSCIYWLK